MTKKYLNNSLVPWKAGEFVVGVTQEQAHTIDQKKCARCFGLLQFQLEQMMDRSLEAITAN
mgnify:CR=1 FL=1